ncbi:uncharacterized protein LOC128999841 [Macrosteles quadrilineatus]|uniref:uncharacterized protein LOC128999841 n=1 Tax=Macrosteles quadrilineatus TaxID=74068 RepID=UPI0023E1CCC4|nr:uncharacterized protein LOC128999841 [Macrosteles quadrilineatus]
MAAPASRRPRSTALPPSPPQSHVPRRKYSLDHGETASGSQAAWRHPEITPALAGSSTAPAEENAFLANNNGEENQNMPLETAVLKKHSSVESVDNYFYDFFDRNCSPSPTVPDNAESVEKGATNRVRNLNVRPRSWVTTSRRVEDPRRTRRRQTDPCGRNFLSDYERALSSLLYQPYECRNSNDDSDVGFWISDTYREPYSTSSSSTSSSSLGELIRRWTNKDPSRAGNTAERSGNTASSDPDTGVPTQTGSQRQSATRHGPEMLVNVQPERVEPAGTDEGSASASVSVNCYRAVPATVSAVPNIQCNVSNVRVVPRTYTSTEAQTDDILVDVRNRDREQRRRERRERRHQRRLANHLHPQMQTTEVWHTPIPEPVDRLPDLLNSHLPPPYSTLPIGLPPPLPPPPVVTTVGTSPQPGLRFPFAIVPVGRRRSPHFASEDQPKSCCGVAVSQTLTVRWFIILIFLVGLCCAIVGTVLGAMKATGREHLTVSLLMIGVGIVLVAVSGVAWRLTSQQAPSCRAMLGLGGDDSGEPNRRFVPRLPPSYGRPHHPYAAMMYPEFQYRAPPPSYQASMQEYRLRLLLLDRHSGVVPGNTVSPPPTYRSQGGSLLRAPITLRGTPAQSEYSRPPSYRSRTSSRPDPSVTHSREPSGSEAGQAVNVITVHPHIIKLAPSPPLPAKGGKDSNLVTIVQTASQPTGPVIVTISGQEDGATSCQQSEMEILAHL